MSLGAPIDRPRSAGEDVARYLLRTVIAGAALVPLGFALALYFPSGGGPASVALVVGVPFLCFVSISAASIVGIPLWFVPRLRLWWMRSGPFFGILALAGAGAIILGMVLAHPAAGIDEFDRVIPYSEPLLALVIPGWIALTFGIMHLRSLSL